MPLDSKFLLFWWFTRFVVNFVVRIYAFFPQIFFGLYPFLDVWELVAHISFLYLVGCVSFTYIYLYLNVVLWELVVLYFYFYLIWKIGCTYIYLHLNVVVRELFTDFPQVGHHSSLLNSSVHLGIGWNWFVNLIRQEPLLQVGLHVASIDGLSNCTWYPLSFKLYLVPIIFNIVPSTNYVSNCT